MPGIRLSGARSLVGTRTDPSDGKSYTFEELVQSYQDQYSKQQLKNYWHNKMKLEICESAAAAEKDAPLCVNDSVAVNVGAGEVKVDENKRGASPNVSFCVDPKTTGAKFTPTYDKEPGCSFASVNPGDQGFRVGGSTLNGQFAEDLYYFGWHETDKYGPFHVKLFAEANSGKLAEASHTVLAENPNISTGFVRKGSDSKVGAVFIDIFKPDLCMHGAKNNMAMLYTVGPRRQDCASDPEFLSQVQGTAENIGRACTEYNETAGATGLIKIDMLRVPLVSGGAFAGTCPKEAVAAALLRGLVAGSGPASPEFNFSYDGDIFRNTWQSLQP